MTGDSTAGALEAILVLDGRAGVASAESTGKHRGLSAEAMAESWLFPGIIASMVLGNQPFPVAQWISQGLNWISIVAGCVVVLSAVRGKIAVSGLMGAVVIAKILRSTGMSGSAEILYVAATNALFCIGGAVVAARRPSLLYKQLMTIALVNVVFMILQVVGVGAWVNVFTTHGEGNLTAPVWALFVPADGLEYLLVQGRPAGLSYSNIILALMVAFTAVLHLTTDRGKKWWGTAVLSVMIVMCMSKFLLIMAPLLMFWLMLTGTRVQRKSARRAIAGIAIALAGYFYAFPGLAATNLGTDTIQTSFFLRLNDIAAMLTPGSALKEQSESLLEGTPKATWVDEGGFVSGYSQLMAKAPLLAPIGVLTTLVYLIGLKSLRRLSPDLARRALLVMCVVAAYPFTFPVWALQMYWFMAGLGLLPVFCVLRPEFLQALIDAFAARFVKAQMDRTADWHYNLLEGHLGAE